MDREIWIVTAAADQRRGGLVATWVSQASIDPQRPTVMAGIAPNHFTSELMNISGAFALHLIRRDQVELVWNFAIGSGRSRDKFDGLETKTVATGSPVVCDCLAWLDCRVIAQFSTGDRILYIADVIDGDVSGDGIPLTESAMIELASEEQRRELLENRDHDVEKLRPLGERWREQLSAVFPAATVQRP